MKTTPLTTTFLGGLKFAALSEEFQRSLWGTQQFYRAFSSVNGGRKQESAVFEGLR